MAETIHIRGEGGAVIAMDLPLPDGIADRLTKGLLRRVNADGTPYIEQDGAGVPAPPAEAPAKSAPKAEWVGWAAAQGADPEDADGMTKADLIEAYGGDS
ncbi:hypothetical protein [Streptomyces roseicoloratus]|uniref:hypothetical protein n=1 Tax=Streptomyces roseicoloratus TaxID=2508722 RepID=UPI001009C669|nr:hypothetical protein [Streptomyces roseicoloratus]